MLVIALETALHFLGPAIDGPFQLYNALRRIMVGQRPGVDFQFFHGVLIPYLHYPLFRMLGGGFSASEMSRQLLSTILYPVSVVLFLKFFLRDWTRTMAWASIVLALSIALRMSSVLIAVNSLLGIRSTLPVLLPVVLCLRVPRAWRTVAGAGMIGGALLLGTEQGLATIAALVIATGLLAIRSRARIAYAVDALAMIAGGVVILLLVLTALGGIGGMRSAVRYNFRTVPTDQYWYFGSPPNIFLYRWSAVPAIAFNIPRMPVVAIIGIVVAIFMCDRLVRAANGDNERRAHAFAVVAIYGVLSLAALLGIWANAYIQPLLRVLLLLGAVLLDPILQAFEARHQRQPLGGVPRSIFFAGVWSVLVMIAVVPSVFATTFVTAPHFFAQHVIGRQGMTYAGIWPATIPDGQKILDAHRGSDGSPPRLWSTYAGLLEARNGLFHPSTDYIIHALGPEGRHKYLDDFRRVRPQLVQTVSPLYTQYETWIEATSWDFYAELLHSYRVAGSTEWSVFWEPAPTAQPAPQLIWSSDVPSGADSIALPAPQGDRSPDLIQIELDYQISNPLHSLPVIGAMPRYLVESRGVVLRDPITLDPYVTQSRFPLVVARGVRPVLRWGTYGLLPGASIRVTRARVYSVSIAPENVGWFRALAQSQSRNLGQ